MIKIEMSENGNFVVTGGWTFKTEAAASAYCDAYNAYYTARRSLDKFSTLSRDEYEKTGAELHIETMPDTDVDSYGVRYGEFRPEVPGVQQGSPLSHLLKIDLAKLRLRGIDQERAAQPKPEQKPDYPQGRKLSCGHTVYYQSEVMTASVGSSCPDCYDRMSD